MRLLPWIFALPLVVQAQGSVEGSIRNSVNHLPLDKVDVTLTGPKQYNATTDETGAFRIPAVLPGDYTAAFDATQYLSARRSIRVPAGGDPARLQVDLTPMGTISGRVFDSDGRPAARVRIELRRRACCGVGTGTDEAGRFEMRGLEPGRYILLALPQKISGLKPPDPAERSAWAPVYYPNGLEWSQAAPIVVRAGADLTGYDVRLRTVPVHRVHGLVLDPDGRPAPGATVWLRHAGALSDEAEAVSRNDGRFEFPAVRAGGSYLTAKSGSFKGAMELTVNEHDLEDVRLRLSAPFTLNGFVDRDEPRNAKGPRKFTMVALVPAEGLGLVGMHQQDGTVQIKNVVPGRYTIRPAGFVPGYYVQSVKLGDQEVMGRAVQLTADSPPFRIVFKPNAPQVRGTVEKCEGGTVVLVPRDESFLDAQFIRSTTCQTDGRFEVGSLRPGDYYALAFDRVDWPVLSDATFVRTLVSGATKVHVKAGESASVDLKVTPWPE